MVDTLDYAYSQGLYLRPKCALETLRTGQMRPRSLADHNTMFSATSGDISDMFFP